MDAICMPAIATAALFTALIFLDMFRREFHLLPSHGILGLFAVLLMSILCNKGGELAAWGLLAVPFAILLIGWIIMVGKMDTGIPYRIAPQNSNDNPCASCRRPSSRCRCLLGSGNSWN